MTSRSIYYIIIISSLFQTSCNSTAEHVLSIQQPQATIDLGELVSPDSVAILPWKIERWGGVVNGRNSYFGFSNHNGAHVDAPNHIGLSGGLESYKVNSFIGRVKVFDVSNYPNGRSVSAEVFQELVDTSDVVLIYTGYKQVNVKDQSPEGITLSWAAAEYLAGIPVKAFGTDSWSVGNSQYPGEITSNNHEEKAMPVHYSFLSRGIPGYEKLINLDKLLEFTLMYFVGVPLNVQEGDGMLVRPIVMAYK